LELRARRGPVQLDDRPGGRRQLNLRRDAPPFPAARVEQHPPGGGQSHGGRCRGEVEGDEHLLSCIVGFHQGGSRTIPLGVWNWRALRIVNAHFREIDTIMTGLRAGLRLVNAGILDPSPLVTHAYPLNRIDEAFHAASSRPDGFKAVVQPAAG
jgi:hypothetical protein